MSSVYGESIRFSLFGQSHGEAVGVTVDGLPAGEEIDLSELQDFLDRRAPGRNALTTQRKESDIPHILSGLYNGKTCGAPLTAIFENADVRPDDYAPYADLPRPSHADYPAAVKYGGAADMRGGGHYSGRLTLPLCFAGGVALQILKRRGIAVASTLASVGRVSGDEDAMLEEIARARADGDSVGGVIACTVSGLPVGLGDGMFGGMENRIAAVVFAVPGVKGVEFGAGFAGSAMRGSEYNDAFAVKDGRIVTVTDHCGGILGGMTDGMPLTFRAAFKPTPSIALPQQSVRLSTMTEETLTITGRHDPCIVLRARPCVEAAAAIAVLDAMKSDGMLSERGTV